jgi:hypothetical protein
MSLIGQQTNVSHYTFVGQKVTSADLFNLIHTKDPQLGTTLHFLQTPVEFELNFEFIFENYDYFQYVLQLDIIVLPHDFSNTDDEEDRERKEYLLGIYLGDSDPTVNEVVKATKKCRRAGLPNTLKVFRVPETCNCCMTFEKILYELSDVNINRDSYCFMSYSSSFELSYTVHVGNQIGRENKYKTLDDFESNYGINNFKSTLRTYLQTITQHRDRSISNPIHFNLCAYYETEDYHPFSNYVFFYLRENKEKLEPKIDFIIDLEYLITFQLAFFLREILLIFPCLIPKVQTLLKLNLNWPILYAVYELCPKLPDLSEIDSYSPESFQNSDILFAHTNQELFYRRNVQETFQLLQEKCNLFPQVNIVINSLLLFKPRVQTK